MARIWFCVLLQRSDPLGSLRPWQFLLFMVLCFQILLHLLIVPPCSAEMMSWRNHALF